MQELTWLDTHIGTLEEAVQLINRCHWNIAVVRIEEQWIVKAGESVILRTESKNSVDTFLYGMALSYSILPKSCIEAFDSEELI